MEHLYRATLLQIAVNAGVAFHFEQEVGEILIENKRAAGVKVNGKAHPADAVVSAGVFKTWSGLISHAKAPKCAVKKQDLSTFSEQ